MPTKKRDPLLTLAEVREQLRVSYARVINLVHEGEFPNAVNIGGEGTGARYRVPQGDVDRFLESRRLP